MSVNFGLGDTRQQTSTSCRADRISCQPEAVMLSSSRVTTILPVVDVERAHDFYSRVLGLKDLGKTGDGKYLFEASGSLIALLPKPEPTKADHTALSFEVADAGAA